MKQVSADGLTLSIDWKRCKAPRVTCETRDPGPVGRCALWTICGPRHQRRQRPPATGAPTGIAVFAVVAGQGITAVLGVKGSQVRILSSRRNFSSSEGVGTSLVPPPSELLSD
ncbi:MAG: hypothetical protein QOE37_2258 [Microbacteriaceae bacterium]|nr:hypothetical protein [Microbacteriaceae bacterium]